MPIATPVVIAGAGPRVRGGYPAEAVASGTVVVGDVGASGGLSGAVSAITIVETSATYGTLAAAIAAAASGQTITVPAGSTLNEWGLNIGSKSLTIRSATVGAPFTVDATPVSVEGGGRIISIAGGSLALVDARLTGNKFRYNHNAGVGTTANSGTVTLSRVEIDECSNGVLQGDTDTTTAWMLYDCNIHDNGDAETLTHNLYFGKGPFAAIRGSWVHNTKAAADYPAGQEWRESWGHLVKSRSKVLLIEASRLTMEVGNANRCIDYPCGGELRVFGSLLEYRTGQNSGIGQAISWGVEGANRISGTTFDDRLFKVNICQNTIVARSAAGGTSANRDAIWIGVGCVSDGSWSNDAPTPAPSEYSVVDNLWCGWDDNPPRVIEGPSATTSTTYAIPGASNTIGALALLTDAAGYDYRPVTPVPGSAAWTAYAYSHPARSVSRVDSYRGAVHSDFGTGSNVGSLVGDEWTPGRGGAGAGDATLVNAPSWALVPVGRWVTVAGTRMDALDAEIKAAVPGWQEFATWDGYSARNFSGVVPDPVRYRFWYGIAGGHGQGSNNGINEFNALTMTWAIECLPSDPAPWPADYRNSVNNGGSYTNYGPAGAAYAAALGAGTLSPTNDWFYDELPATPARNVIQPTAVHNYHAGVYIPERDEIWFGIRRLWGYSRATKTYFYRRMPNDVLTGDWMDGEGIINVYDEATKDILWWANGSTGYRRSLQFNRDNLNWGAPPAMPWYVKSNACFARVGRNIFVFSPPENPNVAYSRTGEYWLWSLQSRTTLAQGTVQFEAGLAITDFVNGSWYHDSACIEWIPELGVYWCWLVLQGGVVALMAIDPTTTPYTLRRVTTTGAVPQLDSGGAEGGGPGRKMVYMPAPMRATVVFDRASRNVHLYRHA